MMKSSYLEKLDTFLFLPWTKAIVLVLVFLGICSFAASQTYPHLPFWKALSTWIEDDVSLLRRIQFGPPRNNSRRWGVHIPKGPPLPPKAPQLFSPAGTTGVKRLAIGGLYPRQQFRCGSQRSFDDYTLRTNVYGVVQVWAWPSLGGVIVLERGADGVDMEFLGLDPLDPPRRRLDDQEEEDRFCKRLLLLGATWWDSVRRRNEVKRAEEEEETGCDWGLLESMENGDIAYPSLRERRWVCVAWPSTKEGGVWVSEFDTQKIVRVPDREKENLCPLNTGRLRLVRSMDERAVVLKRYFAGRWYKNVESYYGLGYLNVWEGRFGVATKE